MEKTDNPENTLNKKIQLKGMTLTELKDYLVANGHKKFRADQVFNWMYNHFASSFNEMENIPKSLRKELEEQTILNTLDIVTTDISSSGVRKLIFKTAENHFIESVIIPEEKRTTLCISTQAGCPLDCKFCATGLMEYKKNLTTGEIFDQYILAQKYFDKPLTNIVYMGMGEPLLNFNSTINSLKIFSEELTTGICLRKITVSTVGIAPKIIELADLNLKIKLAFSLHSCFEDLRNKIMPVNKKYSLAENIKAVQYYSKKTNTRITFEYIMLKDINDRNEDIKALIKLSKQIPSKINLIPFNSLKHMNPSGISARLEPSSKEKMVEFAQKLYDNNITVMIRNTQGGDISAACGQLAIKY
jgi:23S rRNA (adenine2503-C2)-methyltransferase